MAASAAGSTVGQSAAPHRRRQERQHQHDVEDGEDGDGGSRPEQGARHRHGNQGPTEAGKAAHETGQRQ